MGRLCSLPYFYCKKEVKTMSDTVLVTLIPAITALATVWLQTGSKKATDELNTKINNIQKVVDEITAIGKKNNADIAKIARGTKTTESYRLEIDMKAAILEGCRSSEDTRRITALFKSYKELGGNGYIEDMYQQFMKLTLKER